jgi:hypothetical protein
MRIASFLGFGLGLLSATATASSHFPQKRAQSFFRQKHSLSAYQLVKIDFVSIKFWAVDASELHFAADSYSAHAAHSHSVNHYRC